MESFRSSGDWWEPGSSEQKVSGDVEFAPTEGVTLDLNGTLPYEDEDPERISRLESPKEWPVLYGDLGQDGPATVLNAVMTSASSGGYHSSEGYRADRLLVGDHIPQNPSFARADFFVDELPDWTGDSTVRPVIDKESVEEATDIPNIESVYAATSAEVYTTEFEDLEVKISNYSQTKLGQNSAEMETIGVLKVIPGDEASLNTLLDYGSKGLEYLSFAIGTGIYPDKLELYTDLEEQPVEAYYTLLDYTGDRVSSSAEYLYRPDYADFETTFRNWVEHCDLVPEVHQNYRQLIHRSNLSPRLRFLTTVIALEAYYNAEYEDETHIPEEEFSQVQSDILDLVPDNDDLQSQIYGLLEHVANTPSIGDKLMTLMESEKEVVGVFFDISDLASEARERRNSAAHGSSEATPTQFYLLSEKLQLVLEALIARKIGVPEDHLPNALANRHYELTEHLGITEE